VQNQIAQTQVLQLSPMATLHRWKITL